VVHGDKPIATGGGTVVPDATVPKVPEPEKQKVAAVSERQNAAGQISGKKFRRVRIIRQKIAITIADREILGIIREFATADPFQDQAR
jgi:hypothetical protein